MECAVLSERTPSVCSDEAHSTRHLCPIDGAADHLPFCRWFQQQACMHTTLVSYASPKTRSAPTPPKKKHQPYEECKLAGDTNLTNPLGAVC